MVVKTNITTNIDIKLYELAKENGIAWNKAIEQGINMLLIDKRVIDILDMPKAYNTVIEEYNKLKDKLKVIKSTPTPEELEKETKSFFGEIVPKSEV